MAIRNLDSHSCNRIAQKQCRCCCRFAFYSKALLTKFTKFLEPAPRKRTLELFDDEPDDLFGAGGGSASGKDVSSTEPASDAPKKRV